MHIFRSLFYRLATSLLPVTLFGFGVCLSMMLVFANPTFVKGAVRDSGLYNVLVDDLFLQNQSVLGTSISVQDSGVRDAVARAFTPQLLQSTGDHIIDGTYAWLRGETATPQFNVDLTGAKTQAAENVATYAANRAAGLPVCTTAQTRQLYASGLNLYNLSCRPATLTTQSIHDNVRSSLLTSSDFFNGAFISASSITDANGQPLYARLSFIPALYQWIIRGVWILGIIAAVSLAGVMLLHTTRRGGIKQGSVTVLTVGVTSGLLALMTGFVANYLVSAIVKLSANDAALQVKISDIARILVADVRHWWLRIAIIEVVVAVIALVWLRVSRKPAFAPLAEQPAPQQIDPRQRL